MQRRRYTIAGTDLRGNRMAAGQEREGQAKPAPKVKAEHNARAWGWGSFTESTESPWQAKLDAQAEATLSTMQERKAPRLARLRVICGAKTRAGGECRNKSEPGKRRCKFHGGKSTGPKTPEGKARIAEAQRRRWAKTMLSSMQEKLNSGADPENRGETGGQITLRLP